jgi:hypothetical protein
MATFDRAEHRVLLVKLAEEQILLMIVVIKRMAGEGHLYDPLKEHECHL